MSLSFNPFGKKIDNIEGKDLQTLVDNNIREGLFIEYKDKEPSDLAKHLCAFANQFGGWILLGAKERQKERTIECFSGIEKDRLEDIQNIISTACTAHTKPELHVKTKFIHGPIKEIGLTEDRFLALIEIRESITPPHIHYKGGIYQRIDHESKPITDRFSLDKLYEKHSNNNRLLNDFINRFYTNEDGCFLEIYFLSNLKIENYPINSEISFDNFKSILSGEKTKFKDEISLPYDNFQTSAGGYTARQTHKNNLTSTHLTFRWWSAGNCKLTIPLTKTSLHFFLEQKEVSKNHKNFNELLKKKHIYNESKILIIDQLIPIILASFIQVQKIMETSKISERIYYAMRLTGADGSIPYLDSTKYIENIGKNDFPFCTEKSIQIPRVIDISDIPSCRKFSDTKYDHAPTYITTCVAHLCMLLYELFQSLGLTYTDNLILDVYDLMNIPYGQDFTEAVKEGLNNI